jgi:hypothetical protein
VTTNDHAINSYQTLDKCSRNPRRKYYLDNHIEAFNDTFYRFVGDDEGVKIFLPDALISKISKGAEAISNNYKKQECKLAALLNS